MKITRFAQSCFLIETKGKRILVDPGTIQFDDALLLDFWKEIDVILVTHKHSDHCHVVAILEMMKNPKTVLYTSSEVATTYSDLCSTLVRVGDVIPLDCITIRVVKSVHGFLPHLKGGNEIEEGVGYLIDDGEKKVYVVGDSLCFSTEEVCDVLCVPVSNHGLVMGAFDAARFAQQVKASLVIPCHYDNPTYPVTMDDLQETFKKEGIEYKILGIKEMVEV